MEECIPQYKDKATNYNIVVNNMNRSLLLRTSSILLPIACYHMNSKPARAEMSSMMREKLEKLNDIDTKNYNKSMIDTLTTWVSPDYKHVVQFLQDKPRILNELDLIRILYQPPLSPSQKVRVRTTVMRLIDDNELTSGEVDMLLSILTYYGCM